MKKYYSDISIENGWLSLTNSYGISLHVSNITQSVQVN